MYEILKKVRLAQTVTFIEVQAPAIAKKAQAGQFVILRVEKEGERIPLTIAEQNPQNGSIAVIYQVVGATTNKLDHLEVGDCLQDLVGPLGKPTEVEGLHKAAVVSGGVGGAIAYPLVKKLHENGTIVDAVCGFRNKDLVILQDEFKAVADTLVTVTDDGSYGEKALVTDALKVLLDAGAKYDEIFVIGPAIMMKFVCRLTKQYNIKTTVSMNAIMIDGTGMCGSCRLSVGGITKFACVDGPDFDGHLVDFDEAMDRGSMYAEFERHAYEESCNLFKEADHA